MNLSEVFSVSPYINVLSELAERSLTVTDPIRQLHWSSTTKFSKNILADRGLKHHPPDPDMVQGLTTLASGVPPQLVLLW